MRKQRTFLREPGHLGFQSVWHNYKNNASIRSLTFDLTKEEVKMLNKQNCHYCNEEPRAISYIHSKTASKACRDRSAYIYNGIDRIDSTKGYTIDNCVPCCKTCNFMKKNFSTMDFIQHVEKIYKFKVNKEKA